MDDFSGHTPGAWRVNICDTGSLWTGANARLIAAAPDLLAERDRLRAEVERLREALGDAATALVLAALRHACKATKSAAGRARAALAEKEDT